MSGLGRLRWIVVLASLLLAATVVAPSARAQSASDVEAAREKFTRALDQQNAGRWDEALELLREVAAVKSTPQVRFNIALCLEKLGKLVEASKEYAEAEREAKAERTDKVKNEAAARRAAVDKRVPRLRLERGRGAERAKLTVDGVVVDDPSAPLLLDPGSHSVEATAEGAPPFRRTIELAPGANQTVIVELAAPPRREPAPVRPAPTPIEPPKRSVLPFVVGGVGAASLVASGVFFWLRQGTISSLDDACGSDRDGCPESERDTLDRGKTYNTLMNVTLAVGVVGVGAGVALYVLGSPKEPTAAALAPAAPGSIAGASLVGRF